MFTGLIREVGILRQVAGAGASRRLTIQCRGTLERLATGSSVAVEGVCLTVAELRSDAFVAEVMEETFQRTTLGKLPVGSSLNLEPALRADGALDGHLVLGHVDGVGKLQRIQQRPASQLTWLVVPRELLPLIVVKGSIAIDGISLTVVDVDDATRAFSVSLLHQTLAQTSLQHKGPGALVNLEVDVLARYVQRMLQQPAAGLVSRELLEQNGFL